MKKGLIKIFELKNIISIKDFERSDIDYILDEASKLENIAQSKEKTVAIQAVVDEDQVFELVNDLRNAGAKDILVVPIERII